MHCFWYVPVQSVSKKHSPTNLECPKWSTEMEEVCTCLDRTRLPRPDFLAACWRLTLQVLYLQNGWKVCLQPLCSTAATQFLLLLYTCKDILNTCKPEWYTTILRTPQLKDYLNVSSKNMSLTEQESLNRTNNIRTAALLKFFLFLEKK